ncbi:MAG: amidohydrolase [Deltaproteobacteria bacterium]|nr:amidohydrolase [Deltaproteobacteria bacterium]MBW2359968.1 amidohydrolase [Deltaproteobacteria bacterium]
MTDSPAYTIIDSDTHVTEAPDLWTSRVPARLKDRVPRVEWDPEKQEQAWYIGDEWINSVGITAVAGWKDAYPSHPPRYEDAHPGSYDAAARLRYMDELGIWAGVLYPNVGGFGNQVFGRLDDAEAKLACVRAYNDFLIDWSSADRKRLIPVMTLPYWDVSAAVAEIQRCAALGHRGVVFTGEPQSFGLPVLASRHWDPIWAAAQDCKLPVSFHIGSGDFGDEFSEERVEVEGYAATSARAGAKIFMTNGAHVLDLLFSGILERFPRLRFVSVESGVGWIPFLLQCADYQFKAMAVSKERSDFKMLPSEYFKRQIYACCWFETITAETIERVGAENIMFETDFPHPTSIYGDEVGETIESSLGSLSEEVRHRLLWENAAKLYEIEAPAGK